MSATERKNEGVGQGRGWEVVVGSRVVILNRTRKALHRVQT